VRILLNELHSCDVVIAKGELGIGFAQYSGNKRQINVGVLSHNNDVNIELISYSSSSIVQCRLLGLLAVVRPTCRQTHRPNVRLRTEDRNFRNGNN